MRKKLILLIFLLGGLSGVLKAQQFVNSKALCRLHFDSLVVDLFFPASVISYDNATHDYLVRIDPSDLESHLDTMAKFFHPESGDVWTFKAHSSQDVFALLKSANQDVHFVLNGSFTANHISKPARVVYNPMRISTTNLITGSNSMDSPLKVNMEWDIHPADFKMGQCMKTIPNLMEFKLLDAFLNRIN